VDALDELSKQEALRTFPAALAVSLLVLALLVRSLRGWGWRSVLRRDRCSSPSA
jgi:hypothetical protein